MLSQTNWLFFFHWFPAWIDTKIAKTAPARNKNQTMKTRLKQCKPPFCSSVILHYFVFYLAAGCLEPQAASATTVNVYYQLFEPSAWLLHRWLTVFVFIRCIVRECTSKSEAAEVGSAFNQWFRISYPVPAWRLAALHGTKIWQPDDCQLRLLASG